MRQFDYDLLGRPTQDRVTALGSEVAGAVRRIETAYEVRGLVQRVSSYDAAAVGAGSVVNEVRTAYNEFGQVITSWQSHSGAVDTMNTPQVQYGYADGSANTIRPTSLTYPNGRQINSRYASGIDTALSRISDIEDNFHRVPPVDVYAATGVPQASEVCCDIP